jgi:SAM-dependent methyltransferase
VLVLKLTILDMKVREMQVNNRIIAAVWNNIDFLIRFFYCRIGFFSKLFFWQIYSSNPQSLDIVFTDMLNVFKKYNIPIENSTIVEIGPGNSHILAYNFLMLGAGKVILIDKYPRLINSGTQKEYVKNEINYIKEKYDKDPPFIANDLVDDRKLAYIPLELTEVTFENVDIIYSNNVLEHIKNIDLNIKSMVRILKSGGYLYHNIDLRDHYNFNEPFLFYKYEDSVWENYLTREGVSYTNRLRYDDFTRIFKENGFEVIYYQTKKQEVAIKKLSSKFKNKSSESLQTTNLSILLRKN